MMAEGSKIHIKVKDQHIGHVPGSSSSLQASRITSELDTAIDQLLGQEYTVKAYATVGDAFDEARWALP